MNKNILADVIYEGFQEQSAKFFETQALNIVLKRENAELKEKLANIEAESKTEPEVVAEDGQ